MMIMSSSFKLSLSLLLISLISFCSSIPWVNGALVIYGDPSDGVVSSDGGINSANVFFWIGDEASPPNVVLRSFVKFSLAGVSGKVGSATLKLSVQISEKDGVGGGVSPLQNIGLGDCLVIHINDYGTLNPSDFNTPSIGNDPGVLISSSTNPNVGYLSIDVTSAMQDDIDNGRAFTSFMIKMAIDTDNDGLVDRFFFSAAEDSSGRPPIIEYAPPAVGGISIPINKLEIAIPYIALAGLIAAISTVYVIKKRKD
jgi:hypothetical protein